MKIREVEASEMARFVSISRQNEIFYGERNELSSSSEASSSSADEVKFWFAVTSDGNVLGGCCSVSRANRTLISALATTEECRHGKRVFKELLDFVSHQVRHKIIEVVVPSVYTVDFVRDSINSKYSRSWDIDLYLADMEMITQKQEIIKKQEESSSLDYVISSYETTEFTKTLNYFSDKGKKEQLTVKSQKHKRQTDYCIEFQGSLVGYCAFFKAEEDIWGVGPLIAHNARGAKCLLHEIYRDIKTYDLKGRVFIYALNGNKEVGELLEEAGFVKSPRQWTMFNYCEGPDSRSTKAKIIELQRTYFAINSIAFSPL